MSSLTKAKKELDFNREFVGLVDILKKIATSHFQSLSRKKKRFEKFTASFDGFFRLINLVKFKSQFIQSQQPTTGVVIVTSDEGFMGGLNARVVEAAFRETVPGKRELVVLGSHGASELEENGFSCTKFPGVDYEKRYEQAVRIKDFLMDWVTKKKIGGLIVAFPFPVSFLIQKPQIVKLLPCAELFERKEPLLRDESRVFVESKPERMIEYLVGTWITYRLYNIFEDSKIAEYAARAIHLEQSYDQLMDEAKALRHRYFKCKREVVDKGIRETFSSVLLQRKK